MIGNSKCACMPINIFNRHININIFLYSKSSKIVYRFEIMLKFRIVINDGISD